MTSCGTPTFTCVLLLLVLAALYGSAFSKERHTPIIDMASDGVLDQRSRHPRSPQKSAIIGTQLRNNNRGPQRRIDDAANEGDDNGNISRTRGGQKGGKGDRGRTGENGDRRRKFQEHMPLGVNRRTLALAEKVGNASSQFAFKLFSTVYPSLSYDTIISPHSVHTALSMMLLGARKTTKKEIFRTLGLRQAGLNKVQVHRGYHALLATLGNTHDKVILHNANGVFVKPSIPIEVAFREGISQMYSAKFDNLDINNSAGPEAPINNWVANATGDRIRGLLPPGTITPLTGLVLINAIFFNASWEKPFTERLTQPKPFTTADGLVKQLQTMTAYTLCFSYANHQDAEVIELPFRGDRLAMYIFLPSVNSSVGSLVQSLTNSTDGGDSGQAVEAMLQNMQLKNIQLLMPKFTIESGLLELTPHLQNMGIRKAFTQRADFSGISAVDLAIDQVYHKAFIKVNEWGTEAAAATAVGFKFRSAPRISKTVIVDRPFIFAIRDKTTKAVLFLGAFLGQAAGDAGM
ncbi:unnamed protein product [Lymnaea stagnalis]|uniref:Serpin domain-containing protein n=1 Tax=Lymnaea stagnalis TaxID=6523 RepID=A0AAV2IQ75_LYMST